MNHLLIRKVIAGTLFVLTLVGSAEAQTRNRGFTVGDAITASDIDELGNWGVNVVRMWCRPSDLSVPESAEQFAARVNGCLDKLDAQLPSYQNNGIRVVFTLDPPAPIYNPSSRAPQQTIFLSQALQQQFEEAWRTVASHYVGDDRILGFDLLNEPAPGKLPKRMPKWDKLSMSLIAAIRGAGAMQRIYVETELGNPGKISAVNKICKSAKKSGLQGLGLHASFHFYSPFNYTHQGIGGRAVGVALPSAKERKKLEKTLKAATKAKSCDGVYVGEFGASVYASQRAEYFQWLVGYFEARGWDWTNHGYQEAAVWSPDDFERAATMDVLRAFFSLNP